MIFRKTSLLQPHVIYKTVLYRIAGPCGGMRTPLEQRYTHLRQTFMGHAAGKTVSGFC